MSRISLKYTHLAQTVLAKKKKKKEMLMYKSEKI